MKLRFLKRNHVESRFVRLNTRKCEACWKCLEKCPSQVIGKVDLLWHKHALIKNACDCTGCLRCVKACESGALLKIG